MADGNMTDIETRVANDRAKLADTLDTLSRTLSPDTLNRTIQGYGGDIGQQAIDTARKNPAAFVLGGAGLALLISGAGQSRQRDHTPASQARDPQDALVGFDARVAEADAAIRSEATGEMQKRPSAHRMRAAVDKGLDKLPPAARERVLKARKSAILAQEAVEKRARRAARSTRTFVHEQPVATGAIALGLGALVAALLPGTRREDALLGERRDALMRRAHAMLQAEIAALGDTASHALKRTSIR